MFSSTTPTSNSFRPLASSRPCSAAARASFAVSSCSCWDRPRSRLDDLTRDAVLQLLDVPAGLFPPGPRRADAPDVEEPARPETPAHRGQVVSRPSEAGGAPVLAAAESPEEGLADDRRDERAVDGALLGLLRDLHEG